MILSHLLLEASRGSARDEREGDQVGDRHGDPEGEGGQRGKGEHRVEAQDEQEDGDLRWRQVWAASNSLDNHVVLSNPLKVKDWRTQAAGVSAAGHTPKSPVSTIN